MIPPLPSSALLLILCLLSVIEGGTSYNIDQSNDDKNASSSYTKYQHYPPYCSTPQEMAKRAIPPLLHHGSGTSSNDEDTSSRLIHVTAIIRHGARTPYMGPPSYQCWNDYWTNENTGVWNCNLKTYISPPAASKASMVLDGSGMVLEEMPDFLFEKLYDALTLDNHNNRESIKTGNHLNGTCQVGQLLHRGYDQELQNGKHLRQAYFYDGNKTANEHAASDYRMRLWDLTINDDENGGNSNNVNNNNNYSNSNDGARIGDPTKSIYQEPNLRYRADDEQRTLMSGQIFLRGLFEQELLAAEKDDETVVIRLHTADYDMDVMTPNSLTCPKTLDLYNEAYQSDVYNAWIEESMEAKTVQTFVTNELGLEEIPSSILDCLMTTICTDRPLPESLNDYDGSLGTTPWDEGHQNIMGSSVDAITRIGTEYTNIFEQMTNFAVKNFTFPYKYNNAAYPKLGMGPLWNEIMANILPIVDSSNHASSESVAPPPKLALFSGHDTTLMPLLATLGDEVWSGTEWAPYASMMLIEIHEILNQEPHFPSGYAFRLIYNGNVLTSKMDGCAEGSELCDSQILVKQVMPFAKYVERDCATSTSSTVVPPRADDMMTEMEMATHNLIIAPGGVWVIVVLVLSSMAVGSVLTWCLMRCRMRKYHAYKSENVLGDLSMRAFEEDDHYYHSGQGPGIDSAIPTGYGATIGDEKKVDEDALI